MSIWEFMSGSPWLGLALILMAGYILSWPFRLANRWIRHQNIKAQGWPTNPLMDADGDIVHPEKESEA